MHQMPNPMPNPLYRLSTHQLHPMLHSQHLIFLQATVLSHLLQDPLPDSGHQTLFQMLNLQLMTPSSMHQIPTMKQGMMLYPKHFLQVKMRFQEQNLLKMMQHQPQMTQLN